MDYKANIGEQVRSIRVQKGITQKDLAKACNIDASDLSKIEKGKQNISLDSLEKIFLQLGKSIESLKLTSMKLDKIREQLIDELSNSQEWDYKLNDTSPGHYGVEDWEVAIYSDRFFVDIPNRKFTFKNADFSAKLVLGGSKDGFVVPFDKVANGAGTFTFLDKKKVRINDVSIDMDLDVYGDN